MEGFFFRRDVDTLKSVLGFARHFADLFTANRLPVAAAALSYNLTMTFFPLLIVLYSMLGNSYGKALRVLAFAENLMAADTIAAIRDFLSYVATHRSAAMLTAGITVLVTSASAAVRTLQSTIGAMQGGTRFREIWGVLFSVVFSLVLVAGLYVTILIMLAGRGLISQLNSVIPIIDISGSWEYMRFLLLGGIQLLLLWGIYLISRREGERYRTYPGAILASLAMLGVSFAFSAFIGASVRYPLVYGSLASLILLMYWLYSCSLVIFCGAALNIAIRDWKQESENIT